MTHEAHSGIDDLNEQLISILQGQVKALEQLNAMKDERLASNEERISTLADHKAMLEDVVCRAAQRIQVLEEALNTPVPAPPITCSLCRTAAVAKKGNMCKPCTAEYT